MPIIFFQIPLFRLNKMKSYCVSAFLKEKNEFILFISNILFYFKLYEQRPCAAVTVPTLVKKVLFF